MSSIVRAVLQDLRGFRATLGLRSAAPFGHHNTFKLLPCARSHSSSYGLPSFFSRGKIPRESVTIGLKIRREVNVNVGRGF